MTHNITATQGTETIPCKPLVAILGWAMEIYQRIDSEDLRDFNEYFYESFILSYHSDDQERRSQAYLLHKELDELCTAFAQISNDEARELNQYLLNVCDEQMKTKAA